MRILIACEESQAVCIEFRKRGFEAYSCDILPCSGGHPEWHLQQDVSDLLAQKWDAIIAFPPCTHLAVSGAAWFEKKREDGRQEEAIHFFMQFINADCENIAVENPVGIMGGEYILKHFPHLLLEYDLPIKPDQKIQPWQFGDQTQKLTCLWLKGFPELKNTEIVDPGDFWEYQCKKTGKIKREPIWKKHTISMSPDERSKARSKTFPGIAKAMAEQWGDYLLYKALE